MTEQKQIDVAVLCAAEFRWHKVLMIMVLTAERLGKAQWDTDDGFRLIGERIEALVRAGKLEVQGDLRKPRYSEVRLVEPVA